MERREQVPLLVVFLIIGVLVGYGVSYAVYRPQIRALTSEVSALTSSLDRIQDKLVDIESGNKELQEDIKTLKDTAELKQLQVDVAKLEAENEDLKGEIDALKRKEGSVEEQIVIDVYNKVAPAVVFITSTVLTYDFRRRVVPQEGVGSGSIVSPEGYILTNNHVVEGAEFIKVSLKSGEEIDATLVGTDPSTDLAVIKIDPSLEFPIAELGDSDALKVGQLAIAIGNPFELERTVTTGVISALNRTLDTEEGDILVGLIQTDASINPGNSGGPLVNSKGEIIGVNTAIISPAGGSVGVGFAIPINTAKKVMAQLIEKGKVSHPWLGITGANVEEFPDAVGLPAGEGVLIVDVFIGSPADEAGLRGSDYEVTIAGMKYPAGGDIIIEVDGNKIKTMENLIEYLSRKDVGDEIQIRFVRDSEENVVKVILEERP
ncbi:MAG: trypsin-like peptidase domain-containing protein [Candidatus Hydrothermarchaeales archaeon]